jgi:hypothetical protein
MNIKDPKNIIEAVIAQAKLDPHEREIVKVMIHADDFLSLLMELHETLFVPDTLKIRQLMKECGDAKAQELLQEFQGKMEDYYNSYDIGKFIN